MQVAQPDILTRLKVNVPEVINCEPVLAYLRSKAADSKKTADTYCDAIMTLED